MLPYIKPIPNRYFAALRGVPDTLAIYFRQGTRFSLFALLLVFTLPLPQVTPPEFITHEGTQFMLARRPFLVTGTNTHYLPWAKAGEVDALLDDAAAMNLNVVRTFLSVVRGSLNEREKPTIWDWKRNDNSSALGMNGVYFIYWDTAAGRMAFNDGPDGLQRVDELVAKAKQRNIRLLFSLLDFYDYTGGSQQMSAWYGSTDRYTFFFDDARTRADYKAWVQHVLERVNPLTGVAYKDEPTIFGWDLMNEPQFSSVDLANRWIGEMAAYVKSIDPNHLVGSGSEGFFAGKSGSEPTTQLNIPGIDFATWHVYPTHHNVSPQDVVALNEAHCALAAQVGKPVLLEEFGYGAQNADQANVFRLWLQAIASNPDCGGWLFWRLTARMANGSYPANNYERFDIHNDNGPTARVFSTAARTGRAFQIAELSTNTPAVAITPTMLPTISASDTFVMGVNVNGPAVTIEGQQWQSYASALATGLKVTGGLTDAKMLTPQPAVDADTGVMLNTLLYTDQETGTLALTQPIANGSYSVYLWAMENYRPSARSFEVRLQGQLVSSQVGDLALNQWARYGPYKAVVSDGALRIELRTLRGRALLMGFAVYSP